MSEQLKELISAIVREVAELPDRTSPEDWPEAMLVTGTELADILRDRLAALPAQAQPVANGELSDEQIARIISAAYSGGTPDEKDVSSVLMELRMGDEDAVQTMRGIRDVIAADRKLRPTPVHAQAQGEAVGMLAGPKHGITLTPDAIRTIMEWACMNESYDEDDACPVLLWIGETVDEDDKAPLAYGLNVYNDECPENGSVCIAEMPRSIASPTPSASPASLSEGEDEMLRSMVRDTLLALTDPENEFKPAGEVLEPVFTKAFATLRQQLADSEARVVEADRKGFHEGILIALSHVDVSGHASIYEEIVRAVGAENLVRYATQEFDRQHLKANGVDVAALSRTEDRG